MDQSTAFKLEPPRFEAFDPNTGAGDIEIWLPVTG